MNTAPDPFLAEKITALLATATEPMTVSPIARAMGVVVGSVIAPLKMLRTEGLLTQTPNGAYTATAEGRKRASAAIAAEMDVAVQEDADALVAAMTPAMTVGPDEVVWYEAQLLDQEEAITAAFYAENGDDVRSAIIASFHELNPAPLSGWVASAKFALEDHARRPTLQSALRARDMIYRAISVYDPAALPPLDDSREQAIVAALAAAPARRAKSRQKSPRGHTAAVAATATIDRAIDLHQREIDGVATDATRREFGALLAQMQATAGRRSAGANAGDGECCGTCRQCRAGGSR